MSLTHVQKVHIPAHAIRETMEHLREMGHRRMEGFSLWVGVATGNIFRVEHNIVPQQWGHRSESGVCVIVGPEELHRLNVWLYENKMKLIAQIHSHPTDAYHSDTDDMFPIATTHGAFSLVIPNFAQERFDLARCAVYRLSQQETWDFLPLDDVKSLFKIV